MRLQKALRSVDAERHQSHVVCADHPPPELFSNAFPERKRERCKVPRPGLIVMLSVHKPGYIKLTAARPPVYTMNKFVRRRPGPD